MWDFANATRTSASEPGWVLVPPRRARPVMPQVLVADADDAVRRVICRALLASGIAALEAATDADVMDAVAAGTIDVVVLNTGRIGNTTGLILARTLRLQDEGLRLICIGGTPDWWGPGDALPARTTRVLHKPFGVRVIIDHVCSLLAAGRPPRPIRSARA